MHAPKSQTQVRPKSPVPENANILRALRWIRRNVTFQDESSHHVLLWERIVLMATAPVSMSALMVSAYHVDGNDDAGHPCSPTDRETLFYGLEEMKMRHTAGESFQKEVIIDRRSDMAAILTAMWTLADVGIKLQTSDRLTDRRTTRRGKRAWFVTSGNTPMGDPFFKFM